MNRGQILIMHPDSSVRALLGSMLQTLGHPIEEASSDRAAVRILEQTPAAAVVAGADPTDPDALEFLSYVRRKHSRTPIILLFTSAHPERMREALQWGAASVLRYPLPATSLRAAIAQVLGEECSTPSAATHYGHENAHAQHGNGHAVQPAGNGFHSESTVAPARPNPTQPAGNGYGAGSRPIASHGWNGVVGEDQNLRQALELAASIAPTCAPVLIVGEPGTGKSLLARALHERGSQRGGPFVEVDCGAGSEAQLETELFGRRTADVERPGRVAQAAGGTLHISELAALSPSMQFRVLRLIQDGEYEAAGSSTTARADVRFVCSTTEDLARLVAQGAFRQDLYYRIAVVTLNIPPLRHRGEDIDRLADHFRAQFARTLHKHVAGFSAEALDMLRRHAWTGNVRELEVTIQRAVMVCRHGTIEPIHLDLQRRETPIHRGVGSHRRHRVPPQIQPLKEALEAPERQLILQALEALNWNRQETARVLDINRTTLYKKMKKYGLLFDEPAWVN